VTGTYGTCTGTAVSTVTVKTTLDITVNSPTICSGRDTILVLTATGADLYLWNTGDTTTTISVSPQNTTSYTVTGISGTCTGSATATVTINNTPLVHISGPTITEAGNSILLTANGAANYSWSPSTNLSCVNCPNPIASPDTTTTYCVKGITESGCIDSSCITITVDGKLTCQTIYVPDAFSPNGDGVNDIESVFGDCIAEIQFMIFDRWGEKVFEANTPGESWDGTYKGRLMNTAVFVYYLKATLTTGEEISQKGNISLIR
jgi:gliding motility-associated-like protein